MEIIQNVTLDTNKVREFCIKYRFYTRGTNEQYIAMFDMCRKYKGEVEKLYEIATDIVRHSAENSLAEYGYYDITDMMSGLEYNCIDRNYKIK